MNYSRCYKLEKCRRAFRIRILRCPLEGERFPSSDSLVSSSVNDLATKYRSDKLAGSLSLPHGSGKALKVAVFAEGPAVDEARAAGADLVGGEDLIEGIKSGKINIKEIDKCITVPQLMPHISKEISKKIVNNSI
ncbi:50S ribosomal protein L1 [Tanacetum coccineum]|uniref:50S ribosomal protein L1 n=1 Tax=Tanacetum coccineum TaxID=301880 RepID=A0ABQ5DYB0_9ASTR